MDQSNQKTARSMEMLGERMSESGRFMNETFAQLRDVEREFADHVASSSRRTTAGMMAMCCMLILSVVAVGFMFRENRRLLGSVQQNGSLVVQVPVQQREAVSLVRPERVALFEEQLDQVDDGIGEPDREIVDKPEDVGPNHVEIIPIDTEGQGLLSVNEPLRRE